MMKHPFYCHFPEQPAVPEMIQHPNPYYCTLFFSHDSPDAPEQEMI